MVGASDSGCFSTLPSQRAETSRKSAFVGLQTIPRCTATFSESYSVAMVMLTIYAPTQLF
jgi:hypothetical protein